MLNNQAITFRIIELLIVPMNARHLIKGTMANNVDQGKTQKHATSDQDKQETDDNMIYIKSDTLFCFKNTRSTLNSSNTGDENS